MSRLARPLALACVLLVAPATRIAAAEGYVGSAAMFSLEHVTVVYPGGPGQDVAANRLSAERRAAYLENKHGLRTDVAADVELDDAQRAGDLLLLGWNNRLLGTPVAPSPFAVDDGARSFLGSITVGADQDLLFGVPSPYNPERRLTFWSRIDLELDRYLVVPFAGSDWAVYDAYTIVEQGMFVEPVGWPPRRDLAAEQYHAPRRGKLRARRASEHYALRFDPEAMSEGDAEAVLAAREQALARAIALTGKPREPLGVQLYVYPDLEVKRAETDVADPVHSVPPEGELHMTRPFALSPNPHEEIHLVARALWGPCHHTALYEGLPLALEQAEGATEADVFAALVVERGEPVTIAELLDEEALRRKTVQGVGFPLSGLLVRWILETGGRALLGEVYAAKPLTVDRLARGLGLTAEATETAFREWLGRRAAGARDELSFRTAKAESRVLGDAEDWDGAIEALRRALAVRPDDPETRYRLGLLELRGGRLAESEATLRALTRAEVAPEALRYRVFAHYQLGRLLERAERAEEARAEYRRVLDYPDLHDSHRLAREALGDGSDEVEAAPPGGR